MSVNRQSIGNRGRMARGRVGAWVFGFVAMALAVQGLRADDAGSPARAVRLSSVDGQVQISQGKQVVASAAVANAPLFEGSTVTTGDDGRAEIQFEDGSVARISPNSALTLEVLRGSGSSGQADIDVDGGLSYFELQGGGQAGTIRVKFGDSVVTPSGYTVLRVSLDNPPGELAVFSGNAHLERGSALTVDVHGGESVALSANDASRYNLKETIEPDSWDSWNSDRDQVLTSEAASATGATRDYPNGNNPAWNDLDANGNWYNVPGQGNIWSPYEASNPGWEPYGNGFWMNSPGYGYTWISGNSWGYLPYQCGIWNWYDEFGWGWAPGFGGCNPWWNSGFYYGPNIGRGFGGYRPPMRPHPPRHPFGAVGTGLIAVNHRMTGVTGPLPPRDRSSVVTIAGHTALPMHPVNSRPTYEHSASGFVNRTVVTNPGGVPPTGQQGRNVGPTFAPSRPGYPAGQPARNSASPARNSGGSPHSSSGGGGSARHPSGGGGLRWRRRWR